MNEFSLIVGATLELQQGLIIWQRKILEYLNLYYQGLEENARGTKFFTCIQKVRVIDSLLIDRKNDFRSVKDAEGILQSVYVIQETEIEIDGEFVSCMEIETLTNAPWNTIGYVQPQTRKGAATSLVEELVRESQRRQFGGILKAITIPGARQFYRDVCFVETDGSGEMILTVEAAEEFLSRQNELRRRYRESSN